MATELQADNNKTYRLLRQFSSEAKALTIASVALIVTVLALLMAFMALNDAKHAKRKAEYQDSHIEELRQDIAVYRIRAAKLDAWLKAHEIDVEEITK